MALTVLLPTTIAVAPTETTIADFNCNGLKTLTVQITNSDGSQTLSGLVYRRQYASQAWALATLGDFSLIPAGSSVVADLDVSNTGLLRITGTMSGAGGDCIVSARRLAK